MSAEQAIKLALIEYFVALEPELISVEVPFIDSNRRADLLMIDSGESYGFEIKSDRDRIDGVRNQLNQYLGCFDYVVLVLDRRHFPISNLNIPRSVGIMLYSAGSIQWKRRAIKRERLDKEKLFFSLSSSSRLKFANGKSRLKIQSKAGSDDLRAELLSNWRKKYKYGYELLRREMGQKIHSDDLAHLRPFRAKEIIG